MLIVFFGWLLNIPLVFLIYFLIAKPVYKFIYKKHNKYVVFLLSCTILASVILVNYTSGWFRYNKLCNEHTIPIIGSIRNVTYYYIDGVNPNAPFLDLNPLKKQFKEMKISFIEGPNIFRRKHNPEEPPYIKYYLSDEGEFKYIKINKLESTYGYRQIFNNNIELQSNSREVYNIQDNLIISKFTTFSYSGGHLRWLTFPFGIQTCRPSPSDKWFSQSYKRLDLKTFNML